MNLPATSYDRLVEAKSITDKYLNYVYIGNVWEWTTILIVLIAILN